MKNLKYLFIAAMALFVFNACEDVPAPYTIPVGSSTGSGSDSSDETEIFYQSFTSSLGDCTPSSDNENVAWENDYSSACVTGYDNETRHEAEAYLVLPSIDLSETEAAYLEISHVICYSDASTIKDMHKILVSTDYAGDATTAHWTEVEWSPVGSSSFTFATVNVQLPESVIGNSNVYIAFLYKSTTSSAATWEVKSISVKTGEIPEEDEEESETPTYTVSEAISAHTSTASPAIVKGYIVGWVDGQVLSSGAMFNGNSTVATNILLADDPTETNVSNCLPIQLPSGTVRSKVNLVDNPDNYKKFVTLTGSLETYFGVAGLKSVTKALFEGETDEEENTGSDSSTDAPEGSIAAAIAAGAGSATVSGTITATYSRGFIVSDETGSILVYLGEDKGYVEGDVVTVSGTTSLYGGLLQFGSDATVTKTGTSTYTLPEPAEMSGSDLDAYISNPSIKYVKYSGALTISGYYYNVTVDGASTAIGSIAYPKDGVVDAGLSGKNVTITGYLVGVSGTKYISTMATKVVEEGSEEEEDNTTPPSLDGILTVSELIDAYNAGLTGASRVTGYIVGYVQSGSSYNPAFSADGAVETNILLADDASETDKDNCIPVQFEIRSELNLSANPENYLKKVTITGEVQKYFSVAGFKSVSAYEFE